MKQRSLPFPPELIRASAGTGKTFRLTSRLIRLLLHGTQPEQILATTFTRKAAGEILHRLFARLAIAAGSDEGAAKLAQDIDEPELRRAHLRTLLERLIAKQHLLSIRTLDSFFVSIGKSFSNELGLPIGWGIISETADTQLREVAVAEMLANAGTEELRALVQLLNRGSLTRMVYSRLLREVVSHHNLYRQTEREHWDWLTIPKALDDTAFAVAVDAVRQMSIAKTKTGGDRKAWITARDKLLGFLQDKDWDSLVNHAFCVRARTEIRTYDSKPFADADFALFKRLNTHAAAFLLRRIRDQTRATYSLIELFDREYVKQQVQHGGLRFQDLTWHLERRTELLGEVEELYYRLDAKVGHLLLDEFQDTSSEQWSILQPIADEILSQASESRSFFCVGDTKQAIYGWRGGVAEIFDSLEERYPILELHSLDKSYRSAPAVIELVNSLFSDLHPGEAETAYAQTLAHWSSQFNVHSTERTDLAGYTLLEAVPGDEKKERLVATQQRTAEIIEKTLQELPTVSVGILVRSNKTIAGLVQALRQRGIPCSAEGGSPLTDSAAVGLLRAVLTVADQPGDLLARYLVADSPLASTFGFHDHTDTTRAIQLSYMLRKDLSQHGYGVTLYRLAQTLMQYSTPLDARRLLQLVDLGYTFDKLPSSRPVDFIRYLDNHDVEESSRAPVRVMTVHKSKGLEFDVVVLPELDIELAKLQASSFLKYKEEALGKPTRVIRYPNEALRQLHPELEILHEAAKLEQLKESLNVLYVAVTRARHALYMLIPEKRKKDSAASLIVSALCPTATVTAGTPLHETGSKDWYEHARLTSHASQKIPTDIVLATNKQLIVTSAVRRKRVAHRTPSELEGSERGLSIATILRGASPQRKRRGIALHSLFEQIAWLPGDFSAEAFAEKLPPHLVQTFADKDIADTFIKAMAFPEIAALFKENRYLRAAGETVHVANEVPFILRMDDGILRGAIDRLVFIRSGDRIVRTEIIDFKGDILSDEAGDGALDERVLFYRPQLNVYRDAVSRLFQLPLTEVSSVLAFVHIGRTISPQAG